ncbi:MAG TPA: carotenoid biosynthesis protein [Polyangiales bacterium]|jgi:hypothetical protein|nr:carotenoid biosynthesis protein [Polyangiales bacterium]
MRAEIPAYFICLELSVFALFAWGFYTAVRRGRLDVMTLIAACLVGFTVEYLFGTPIDELPGFLQALMKSGRDGSDNYYRYPQFLVMITDVPLWIVLGWASIIHAARRTTERLGFGLVLGSLACGLLAASIDFVLDPIAEAVGYWKWYWGADGTGTAPPGSTAFGIPIDNFMGWMMIVAGLSFTLRLSCNWIEQWRAKLWLQIVLLTAAMFGGVAIVVVLQSVFDKMYTAFTPQGTFMLVYGTVALLTVTRLPSLRRDAPIEPWTLAVVGFYHFYQIVMLVTQRVYVDHKVLIAFMPLMAFGSMLAFAWPSIDTILARFGARRAHSSPDIDPSPAQ